MDLSQVRTRFQFGVVKLKDSDKKEEGVFKKDIWEYGDAKPIVAALRKNRYIENVDLSTLLFSSEEWNEIVEQIKKDEYIQTLNLSIEITY